MLARPHSRRAVAALLLLVIAAPACALKDVVVKKPPDRVTIKGYPLELAYGEEPPAPPSLQLAIVPAEPLVPEFEFAFTSAPSFVAPFDPCPLPGADVFPAEPASLDVTKPILPGTYLFKQEGSIEIAGLFKAPLTGLTQRRVQNFIQEPAGPFSFEVLSSAVVRTQIQTFRVVPNDGIYLTRVQTQASQGSRVFTPLLPVEVFPLPVTVGAPFTALGFDIITGEVMTAEGRVTGRERVEGCNEVVDAWKVDGSWTFQRPGSQPLVWNYDYWVAPHLGGFFVGDHLVTTEVIGGFTFRIDQKTALAKQAPVDEGGSGY